MCSIETIMHKWSTISDIPQDLLKDVRNVQGLENELLLLACNNPLTGNNMWREFSMLIKSTLTELSNEVNTDFDTAVGNATHAMDAGILIYPKIANAFEQIVLESAKRCLYKLKDTSDWTRCLAKHNCTCKLPLYMIPNLHHFAFNNFKYQCTDIILACEMVIAHNK